LSPGPKIINKRMVSLHEKNRNRQEAQLPLREQGVSLVHSSHHITPTKTE